MPARRFLRILHRINSSLPARQFVVGAAYSALTILSLFLAYQLRLDFELTANDYVGLLNCLLWILPLKLGLFFAVGMVRAHPAYFSVPSLRKLVLVLFIALVCMLAVRFATRATLFAPPISVALIDFFLSLSLIAGLHLVLRVTRQYLVDTALEYAESEKRPQHASRVAIIGAGDAGTALVHEILLKPRFRMKPVAFFDDDRSKWHTEIHGVRVLGAPELLRGPVLKRHRIEQVIIAMPSASARRIKELVTMLEELDIPGQTIPSLELLAKGKVQVSQMRPVGIEDLLGREPVKLDTTGIQDLIRGKVVMVTGAGGSIGSELCRQIADNAPSQLLLVEQSEGNLFEIERELTEAGRGQMIVPLIADITDGRRMRQIFDRYRPQLVFHAAAHKHVPMMEGQPGEAVKNNSLGTAQVADLSLEFGVERFVLISTDKAINPRNVMGATKRLAELYIQALNSRNSGCTKFMAVRFGNVLGSSGSVIPIFKRQIAAGGPVTVTCPEVTRYFMTIPEAVGLVIQCATQGQGGEIFVLDMGKPVKILDLATQLIRLSGFRPNEDIEIKFTGLRPGEKCFEELNYASEAYLPTKHPAIMRFTAEPMPLELVLANMNALASALPVAGNDEIKLLLQKAVPEYKPLVRCNLAVSSGDNGDPSANCPYITRDIPGYAERADLSPANCPCLRRDILERLAPTDAGVGHDSEVPKHGAVG